MDFQFFNTQKPKRFTYRPRFYDPAKEEGPLEQAKKNQDFGARLHHNWDQRRTKKEAHKFPLRSVIWVTLIILTLIYLYYKFIGF